MLIFFLSYSVVKPVVTNTSFRVGAARGSNATLFCAVKGFPDPVGYWHKDRVMLTTSDKFTTIFKSAGECNRLK